MDSVSRLPPPAAVAERGEEENRRGDRRGAAYGAVLPGRSDDSENGREPAAAVRRSGAVRPPAELRRGIDGVQPDFGAEKPHSERSFENPGILEILPEYNTRLCQVGALLISYRARFYDSLGKAAANYHNQFSGGAENFTLSYKTVSTVIDPFAPVPELTQNLLDHLQSHSRAELETAQCLTGPHKDDFTVSLSGIDLKAYGSQGQTRTAAISLKLAQRELMAREWGEEPVLLLDDVLSELDPGRQDFVLNKIVSGQVFITCCEPGRFTKLGRTIQVENGSIVD